VIEAAERPVLKALAGCAAFVDVGFSGGGTQRHLRRNGERICEKFLRRRGLVQWLQNSNSQILAAATPLVTASGAQADTIYSNFGSTPISS
jgi:hypothetical protein